MTDLRQQLETSLGTSYSVERELGGGGMSRVFLAEETQLGRKVVIKLLAPEFAEGLSVERFEREIRVAAGLQEPHIVPVIAAGVAAGLPFYTMPFIAGESLRARLSVGRVPLREALSILTDVATALEYAHERGIVHRDIKPENILLSKRSAVVTDFGIAKAIADSRQHGDNSTLTAVGTSLGTPPYMAPEQIAADPTIDQRADLYALGVVAYEIFTGSTPFAGRAPTQLVAAIMSEEPEPLSVRRPDLPPTLTALVARLLAKDRAARPASAAEVLRALDDIDVTGAHRSTARLGKRRLVAGLVAAAVVAVAAGYAIRSRIDAQTLKERDDTFWVGGKARRVAVLPFTTTSGDTADVHFAEDLTDELISALGRVQGLRVTGRASTQLLKGKDPRLIAESLKVETLVEGSVHRAEGRIKTIVSLLRPSDGGILWSSEIDRKNADVFDVREEIAAAVVDSLHVRRDSTPKTQIVTQPTRDLIANGLFLEGKRFANTRRAELMDSAVARFDSATKRDTGFALAFSAMADAYVVETSFRSIPVQHGLDLAEKAADRAIKLDSSLGEAHSSKGFVLMNRRGSLDAAEASFKTAFNLSPSLAWARHYYSMLLTMENRQEAAELENRHALMIDPLLQGANTHRATLLIMRGDYVSARQVLNSLIRLNSAFAIPHYFLGIMNAAEGNYPAALASLDSARQRKGILPGLRSALAYTYSRVGQTAKADSVLKELRATGDDDQARIDRGLGEAVMGDNDRAYAILLTKPRWDFASTVDLRANPLLAKFRQDRRYAVLLGTMGLKP